MTSATPRHPRRGFTLIELSIVVLIIGVIVSFIAVVGVAAAEQGRLRATQGLIAKLEAAINDRLAALTDVSVNPNGAHRYLASITYTGGGTNGAGQAVLPWGLVSEQRAVVIAQMDYLKREMPDVFTIQGDITAPYPVNFAGLPYPPGSTNYQAFILPLGNRAGPGFNPSSPKAAYTTNDLDPDGDGNSNVGPGAFAGVAAGSFGNPSGINQQAYGGVADDGIYGASYTARAALNQLIGYNPIGTDRSDNNGDGLIDEVAEGTNYGNDAQAIARINTFLANHAHVTARSETLYALLVHGSGPLGSLFRPEDFTGTEVKDTDNDGIPEFVDGWGKPLQFYRWPIYRPSGNMSVTVVSSGTGSSTVFKFSGQRGSAPYNTPYEARESFPFDQNKQLVAPAWFGTSMGSPPGPSAKALLVMSYFTSFIDPNWYSGTSTYDWDMTGTYARSEFAAKFLILSAGPDGEYGTNVIGVNYSPTGGLSASNIVGVPNTAPSSAIVGEGWGAFTNGFPSLYAGATAPPDTAVDDITNLDLKSDAGGVQ